MHKFHLGLTGVIAILVSSVALGADQRPRQGELKVGTSAPDFTIKDVEGKHAVTLSNLRGKPVVLIFGSCT